MVEGIGIVASLLVLVSFLFKDVRTIRLCNILGALVFVIYGILTEAISVWFLNGALVFVHVYHILKGR